MEIIASLVEQLESLCATPDIHPQWLLDRLSDGLRERYGSLSVGFVQGVVGRDDNPAQLTIIGLLDESGRPVVAMPAEFAPESHHPTLTAQPGFEVEAWTGAANWPATNIKAVDEQFARNRSAFLVQWLIDTPTDWAILILSPIAAPASHRADRGLSVTANLLATNLLRALDAARLAKANRWIEREMEEIAHLQQLLQPQGTPQIQGIDVAYSSHIFQYAGGDYFDVPKLSHLVDASHRHPTLDYWGAIIADVSGHGPSAAVEAAMLDAIMRTYPGPVEAGPEVVTEYINRHLFTRRPRASFITAFLCNFFPLTETLAFVNAGHPPPVFMPAGGQARLLDEGGGIPLRIERDRHWTREEMTFAPGDVLVLYTDGLTESRDLAGEEFGSERIVGLTQAASHSAQSLLDDINAAIKAHLGGRTPDDDQTLIVIRRMADSDQSATSSG